MQVFHIDLAVFSSSVCKEICLHILSRFSPTLSMPDLHSLPHDWWPSEAIRNNGPDALVLERAKLRELAEGWPCYRYVSRHRCYIRVLKAYPENHTAMHVSGRTLNPSSMRAPSCTPHGRVGSCTLISLRGRRLAWTKVHSSCIAVMEPHQTSAPMATER